MDRWLAAPSAVALRQTLLSEDHWRTVRVGGEPGELAWDGLRVRELSLPKGTLLALVRRDEHGIIPDGDTQLQKGDLLTVIGDATALQAFAVEARLDDES